MIPSSSHKRQLKLNYHATPKSTRYKRKLARVTVAHCTQIQCKVYHPLLRLCNILVNDGIKAPTSAGAHVRGLAKTTNDNTNTHMTKQTTMQATLAKFETSQTLTMTLCRTIPPTNCMNTVTASAISGSDTPSFAITSSKYNEHFRPTWLF